MKSYILEALPGIHGILIGVGVAFFSAFAMFAYQQLQGAKDQVKKALLKAEAFSTPSNYISYGDNQFLKDDGEIDWDGEAKNILFLAKSFYSYLDLAEQYGIPPDRFQAQKPIDEEVSKACKNLCILLYYLFVSYPLSGKSIVVVPGVTEKINEKKKLPFDMQRLQEIDRRIHYLCWYWSTNKRSLIALGQRCTEIEKSESSDRERRAFEKYIADSPEISETEKQGIWTQFHQPTIDRQTDYSQIISKYFNKASMYRDIVLPKLNDLITVHDTFNERFHLKHITLKALKLFWFVSLLGVVFPMVIINLQQDYDVIWLPAMPYILLFLTILPYGWYSLKLYRKIGALNFK